MGDYACNYCNDWGNCARCSYFWERDKVHAECGHRWGDHEVKQQPASNQGVYPPWAECPPKEDPT